MPNKTINDADQDELAGPCAPSAKGESGDGSNDAANAEQLSEDGTSGLVAQNSELNDRLRRTLADFENFKKRSRQQHSEQLHYANEKLIADLLPIIDNFNRALQSPEVIDNLQSWKSGVEMIARQLAESLSRYGLRSIESVNTEFDPTQHEAIGQVETTDVPAGYVAEEIQKGYFLHDRLLRPSRVRVAISPTADADSDGQSTLDTES